jgi:hypothetical protein
MSSLQPGPSFSVASPDCRPPPHAKTFFSWMTETTAKSACEAERRLCAVKSERPGPLSHLLCVFARWDAYVIEPRPFTPCGEKRRDARSLRSCHGLGLRASFPVDEAGPHQRTIERRASERVMSVAGRVWVTSLGTKPIPASYGLFADFSLTTPNVIACVGGLQSGVVTLNEEPGGSELITCSDARRSTLH